MPAVSKKQQRLMGMVHALQKGDILPPSKEITEIAKSIGKGDAKEFAKTKHKGLPEKTKKKKSKKKAFYDLKVLTKLANDLDDLNLNEAADQIDLIIRQAVETEGEVISLMPHLDEKQLQQESVKFDAIKSEIQKVMSELGYVFENYLPDDEAYLKQIHKKLNDTGATIVSGIKEYRNKKAVQLKTLISDLVSNNRMSRGEAEEILDQENLDALSTSDLDQAITELAAAYKFRKELPEEATE